MKLKNLCYGLTIGAAILAIGNVVAAQTSELGTINFPTSGSKDGQAHFLRGVGALHSFWYEEATEAFQEAQKIDPNFAMAYWGEAMSYNHPLWEEQDLAETRKALGRLGATRKARAEKAPTPREKAYLEAVEILYGEGGKHARDRQYSAAMERLVQQYPDDAEAACFYALSLLGTVRPGEKGFRRQMKSAAILEEVFRQNPNHPGAAHYLIHSYDDPEHAPLGLAAARSYAKIAPAAHHATHMPSHIFVQLGMWSDVATSNEAAYAASDAWVKRKGLSPTKRDYHSFAWAQYAYLQQGRYGKARQSVDVARKVFEETGESRVKGSSDSMYARYVVETGEWQKIPLPEPSGSGRYTNSDLLFAAGLSAAKTGDFAMAEEAVARLKALREKEAESGKDYRANVISIAEKELAALIHLEKGQADKALELAKEAAATELTLDPPSGPPDPIKPAPELYGEILLQRNQPKEAAEQFGKNLSRMPNRAASLLGLARAAAKLGDMATARKYYGEFLKIWSQADARRPELDEARGFVVETSGP